MLKKVIGVLVVLVLVAVLAMVLAVKNLDPIVKAVVEEVGTKVTGTAVTVGSVETDLKGGRAILRELALANPEGFSQGAMFSVGELSATVDFESGAVRDVRITEPYIYAEQRGAQSNFEAVQEYMASKSQADPAEPVEESPEPDKPPESSEPVRLQIDHFELTDAEVAYQVVDTGQTGSVTVAEIAFDGLQGTPEDVARQAIRQLAQQVVAGVLAGAVDKGKQALRKEADDRLEEARGELEEELSDVREDVGEKLGEAMGGLKERLGK